MLIPDTSILPQCITRLSNWSSDASHQFSGCALMATHNTFISTFSEYII